MRFDTTEFMMSLKNSDLEVAMSRFAKRETKDEGSTLIGNVIVNAEGEQGNFQLFGIQRRTVAVRN
jgi:hypothetical protein